MFRVEGLGRGLAAIDVLGRGAVTLFTSACKPSTVFNVPNCEFTFEIAGVAVAPGCITRGAVGDIVRERGS